MWHKSVWIRLGVIAGLLGSLMLVAPAFAQATIVRVDPAATTIAQNQSVTVSIKIDNVTNLGGAEIHLAFNPNVLEVLDADQAQAGAQIANGGMLSPDFTALNMADNALGTIDFDVAQINKPGVNGNGTLVIINFRGKAGGTSPITFRGIQAAPTGVNLSDAGGLPIASSLQSGSVTVTSQVTPATPTPTNTPGPTPTPTPTGTPGSGTPGRHVVRAGETLYCIGRAYGVSPWAIATTNRLFSPYRLFVGQVLTIPNVPWTNIPAGPVCARQFPGTPPPVTPGPGPTPPGCRASHAVVRGDTLFGIARRYGVNIYTLAARNNIFNLNLIYVGQVLCIP
ncbi:MAG TPA: LysM peptidoglycan-binding domain-containing protein [Anaerolineae bacterium]|nr:LysM peptidoglycan-binding domain-containing protein [Anaerolineae bacterium]